jgi:hypothetical protein
MSQTCRVELPTGFGSPAQTQRHHEGHARQIGSEWCFHAGIIKPIRLWVESTHQKNRFAKRRIAGLPPFQTRKESTAAFEDSIGSGTAAAVTVQRGAPGGVAVCRLLSVGANIGFVLANVFNIQDEEAEPVGAQQKSISKSAAVSDSANHHRM